MRRSIFLPSNLLSAPSAVSLQELISAYGYWAIAVGTFLEGETILVLGGLAAHRGYLELRWVVACACLGTLVGDQLFF